MLIIFDVDGTLIQSDPDDWDAYKAALQAVLGFRAPTGFCHSLPDLTAHLVAEAAAQRVGRRFGPEILVAVRDAYLENLHAARSVNPTAFPARPGASMLLGDLGARPGVQVAIATGDWLPTIRFKLNAAGIDVSPYPIATASDMPRRADIIRLAAARAGRPISEAIYVGDGVWDLRACAQLRIPFIATGSHCAVLSANGARYLHPEFASDAFLALAQRAAAGL